MKTVVVRSFDNYFSANIILTRLQDSGINCYLNDEYSATVYPVLSNSIGGIKLAVDVNDAEKAKELLLHFHEEHMREAVCPRCTINDFVAVATPAPKNFLRSLLNRLFPGHDNSGPTVYQCRGCGYECNTLPENTIALN